MKLKQIFHALVVMLLCSSLVLGSTEVKMRYVMTVDIYYHGEKLKFNEKDKTFEDSRFLGVYDNWVFTLSVEEREKIIAMSKRPYKWPSKKRYDLKFKPAKLFNKPENFTAQAAMLAGLRSLEKKHRVVIINVEGCDNMPLSVRCHPHLGLLYIGTVARLLGHEVVLHDELVQGKCDITKLIHAGDIVGFSLVITGIERGVELAYQAKLLGAIAVLAGNDSANFRCNQLLALPGKPFDGIFTSNSLNSWRQFLSEFNGRELNGLNIPEFKTFPGGIQHSNQRNQLLVELKRRKEQKVAREFDMMDGFIIPDFSLFPAAYWETAWQNFREVYGHKHLYGKEVRNALGLLAQGCTRTQGTTACEYCSIFGVGDVRVPSREYLAATLDAYNKFRITEFYNVTDSAFEMTPLVSSLEDIEAEFNALTIYARAQGVATNPKLLNRWLARVRHRLQLNVGMDSGDPGMLASGIIKSSVSGLGSRLEENRQAVLNIQKSGAHLHYSMIFGAPGETRESCQRTLEFVEWTITTLGQQLDLVESDLFWLNFGSPASQVFTDYMYAQSLAAKAGKTITRAEWWQHFGSRSQELVVAWATERAWYEFFTNINLDTAQEFNACVTKLMSVHTGSIGGRSFFPREKEV